MRRCRICNAVVGNRHDQQPVEVMLVDTDPDPLVDAIVIYADALDPRCTVHAALAPTDGG